MKIRMPRSLLVYYFFKPGISRKNFRARDHCCILGYLAHQLLEVPPGSNEVVFDEVYDGLSHLFDITKGDLVEIASNNNDARNNAARLQVFRKTCEELEIEINE